MTARQHDAHVRARRALARRVIDRRLNWGLEFAVPKKQRSLIGWEKFEELMLAAAMSAISVHQWREGWGNKLSAYRTFGPPQRVVGTFADVPANEVHQIMCDLHDFLRPAVEAEYRRIRAERKAAG